MPYGTSFFIYLDIIPKETSSIQTKTTMAHLSDRPAVMFFVEPRRKLQKKIRKKERMNEWSGDSHIEARRLREDGKGI